MKYKNGVDKTHIDIICIDVVICAFQNDPRGIICRGREREEKGVKLQLEKDDIGKERQHFKKRKTDKISRGKQVEKGESVMGNTKSSCQYISEHTSQQK